MELNRRGWFRVAGLTTGLWVTDQLVAAPPRWRGAQGVHRDSDSNLNTAQFFRPTIRDPRLLLLHEEPTATTGQFVAQLENQDGDFRVLKDRGWVVGRSHFDHIQLINVAYFPGTANYYGVAEFPWVGCLEYGHIVRVRKKGCAPPLNAATMHWLLTGKHLHLADEPAVDEQPTASENYRVRQRHWHIDGDFQPIIDTVLTHLHGPVHRTQIPGDWKLDQWSYDELRSLHDDLHEWGQPIMPETRG